MEVKRYIEVSEKLRRLLEDAERQAKEIIGQAEEQAEKIVTDAGEEAKNMRLRAETGEVLKELIKEAEKAAEDEAKKILEEYEQKLFTLKEIPQERIQEAVELVLRRVLP